MPVYTHDATPAWGWYRKAGLLPPALIAAVTATGGILLLANDPSLSSNQYLYSKLPYDPVKDLVPVVTIATTTLILLLGMIILIAGFNIIGILTMMVGERRREIGILLAMGTKRSQVMGIFLFNGVWLGVVGVFYGTLLGLAGVFFLDQFGINLPGDVYLVETVPVLLQWVDVLLIALVTLVMSLAAGLWPSWEASNLKPMDIIRYT